MRRLLAALLVPLGIVGCAHSTFERLPDGTVRAETYALGQASATVSPEGAVEAHGGPLSEVFSMLVISVAAMVSPWLGAGVAATEAVSDATAAPEVAP